jgi:hypothetical protein
MLGVAALGKYADCLFRTATAQIKTKEMGSLATPGSIYQSRRHHIEHATRFYLPTEGNAAPAVSKEVERKCVCKRVQVLTSNTEVAVKTCQYLRSTSLCLHLSRNVNP